MKIEKRSGLGKATMKAEIIFEVRREGTGYKYTFTCESKLDRDDWLSAYNNPAVVETGFTKKRH